MKPWIPLVASGLVLFYGAVSAWSEWAYRDNAPAPSWCKRWLLDGEKLAQAAYPLQWEGEAGRAAAVKSRPAANPTSSRNRLVSRVQEITLDWSATSLGERARRRQRIWGPRVARLVVDS